MVRSWYQISTCIYLTRTGPITCRNYARLGYQRLTRGVYGHVPDTSGLDDYNARRIRFMTQVRAITAPYAGSAVALFGATALQALGVALPARLENWDSYHLLVPRGAYQPERRSVIVHRASDFNVWRRSNELTFLNPVDHWAQLRGSQDELIEVGDGLVRRQHPLLTTRQLRHRLGDLAGAYGIDAVRRAARWVVPGTDSLYETRLRLIIIRAGLPRPAVNLPVFVPSVGRTYHLDLGYEAERIGVEFDGLIHVGNRRQMEIDAVRRRDLQDAGWYLISVTASQLANPAQFLQPLERALILRSHRQSP